MTQKPQSPIAKAHLEGVEMLGKEFKDQVSGGDWTNWDYVYPQLKSFLTTYGISIAKAAKEAGHKGYTFEEVEWEEGLTSTEPVEDKTKSLNYAKGFNDCRSSFHSAIDEGIEGIKKGNV